MVHTSHEQNLFTFIDFNQHLYECTYTYMYIVMACIMVRTDDISTEMVKKEILLVDPFTSDVYSQPHCICLHTRSEENLFTRKISGSALLCLLSYASS